MWLLKKLHTYAGLLTFVNLMVYGVVGLSVSYLQHYRSPAPVVTDQPFTVPPNLTDLQVAEKIADDLHLSLAKPVHSFVIQHDASNNLVLDFRHANGEHKVTVFERRLRIETTRNTLPLYLYILHETTAAFHSGDWRMQLWADYNEFALWSLLAMIVSGFAISVASRSRSRLAQISLATGCAVFAALWFWTK